MVVAKELAKRDYRVVILEAARELGGKAKAPLLSDLWAEAGGRMPPETARGR